MPSHNPGRAHYIRKKYGGRFHGKPAEGLPEDGGSILSAGNSAPTAVTGESPETPLYSRDAEGNLVIGGFAKLVNLTRHATTEERITLDQARRILDRLSDEAQGQ